MCVFTVPCHFHILIILSFLHFYSRSSCLVDTAQGSLSHHETLFNCFDPLSSHLWTQLVLAVGTPSWDMPCAPWHWFAYKHECCVSKWASSSWDGPYMCLTNHVIWTWSEKLKRGLCWFPKVFVSKAITTHRITIAEKEEITWNRISRISVGYEV